MLNVVIAGFDKALSSAMTGVADLFGLAGVTWNRIQGQELERLFNVRIASPDGGPIRCINGIQLLAHMSYDDVQDVGVFVDDQLQDLPLAAGQHREYRAGFLWRCGAQAVHDCFCHLGAVVALPGPDFTDGFEEFRGIGAFEQVAGGAFAEHGFDHTGFL